MKKFRTFIKFQPEDPKNMSKIIRIGIQHNPLAVWQANAVRQMLEKLGQNVEIKSSFKNSLENNGDLYAAMLNNEIDIAVHSLEEVPTVLPKGISQAAVIKRGNFKDILVFKNNEEFLSQRDAVIATGSARHRAQWLNRYPTHSIVNFSGDLSAQLQKFEEKEEWNAAIFAAATLGRLGLKPENSINLDWMIPTPGQGAIVITVLEENQEIKEICKELNHEETQISTSIEREFLHLLEGDSNTPMGALAFIKGEEEKEVHFKGVLFSPDGSKKIEVNRVEKLNNHHNIATYCADFIIERGGKNLIDTIKRSSQKINVFSTRTLTPHQRLLFNEKVVAESSDFE